MSVQNLHTSKSLAEAALARVLARRVEMPAYHPGQQRVIDSDARFKVLACGRRWGKTIVAIRRIGEESLAGKKCAYFSMTYKNLSETWDALKELLAPATKAKNEQAHTLELFGGGSIEMWSLENGKAARGRQYDFVVIDEAAFIPDLGVVWRKVIRPTLMDTRGGALIMSSPRGHNDFKVLYVRGLSGKGWASFTAPTWDNPYISPDEIEDARGDLTEKEFAEEIAAEFLSGEGAVFRNLEAVCRLKPAEPYAGAFAFGVDWGRDNDYTAVSVIDTRLKHEVALVRFRQVGYDIQRGRLQALADIWKPMLIYAESNSIGAPNIEALQSAGLPVRGWATTAQSKPQLIQALALAVERGDVALLEDEIGKAELQVYEAKRRTDGSYSYSAPSGMHDDTVIARALALQAIIHRPVIDFA
jgi:phage FluMu gp28-like protein